LANCGYRISNKYKINTIALSGGCFHNSFLKENLIRLLQKKGIKVIYQSELPSGDGGISFGQIIIANSILSGEKSCVSQYL
jgi:hydrogenase maturation protein HypF